MCKRHKLEKKKKCPQGPHCGRGGSRDCCSNPMGHNCCGRRACVLPCRGWGGVSPQDDLLPAQECRGSLGCTMRTPQPFLGPADPNPRLITPCTIPMHGHLTLPKNPCLHRSCQKGSREEERCQVGNRRICLGRQKGLADLHPRQRTRSGLSAGTRAHKITEEISTLFPDGRGQEFFLGHPAHTHFPSDPRYEAILTPQASMPLSVKWE